MRIALYLAKSGVGARRKTEKLVQNGEVTVNGNVVTDFSYDVKESDRVEYQDQEVKPLPLVYYLLNKPAGYTCSLLDEHAEKLITELIPDSPRVWPVGRLDRETEGLIFLTNDGDITYKMTHPKFEKEKVYEVEIENLLSEKELNELISGVMLEDGFIKPDKVTFKGKKYIITIHSGKKRVIRRIFGQFDRKIIKLKRTEIGNFSLAGLQEGAWRQISEQEIKDKLDV